LKRGSQNSGARSQNKIVSRESYLVKNRIQEPEARILNSLWNELKDTEFLFPLPSEGEG